MNAIQIKKLNPDATLPVRAHDDDAGHDVFCYETFTLQPGERKSVPLGFALALPKNWVALMWAKSGLSHRKGIQTIGGVVDAGYRGEVSCGLINHSDEPYTFQAGDKVAQMLIQEYQAPQFEIVEELADSVRGENAYGSTGR